MAPKQNPNLEVTDLSYALSTASISVGSFALADGELLWVTGPNGCGKTTLLKVLLGWNKPRRGKIQWAVESRDIQYVPQLSNNELSVPLTLKDVLEMDGPLGHADPVLVAPAKHQLAWNTASGGERKRILLERALRRKPRVLILDEPFNHLDLESRNLILSALARYLTRDQGSVIVVSHDALPEGSKFKDVRIRRLDLA